MRGLFNSLNDHYLIVGDGLLELNPVFAWSGGTINIIISSNSSWTISKIGLFITLNKTSGSNNDTFSITASTNTLDIPREATVTVANSSLGISRTIYIGQDGKTEPYM